MGKTITAKLIPRAKSTSVLIDFNTAQGKLTDVRGIEFETLQMPELDIKEFKSAFFDVTIDDVPPGSEAEITISSSFFTVSTEYWLYNTKNPTKWFDSGTKTESGAGDSNQFVIRVVDGGTLDSDGMADGRIQIIGGPKDNFWSYAIGTLFVRFFGIFLVLSMLMIGILSAGKIFVALEKRRTRLAPHCPNPPNCRLRSDQGRSTALMTHPQQIRTRLPPLQRRFRCFCGQSIPKNAFDPTGMDAEMDT